MVIDNIDNIFSNLTRHGKLSLDYSWKYHKAHAIRLYAIF